MCVCVSVWTGDAYVIFLHFVNVFPIPYVTGTLVFSSSLLNLGLSTCACVCVCISPELTAVSPRGGFEEGLLEEVEV